VFPGPLYRKKRLTCACSCAILDTDQTSRDDLWSAAVGDLVRGNESALAANIEVSQSPLTVRVWRAFLSVGYEGGSHVS